MKPKSTGSNNLDALYVRRQETEARWELFTTGQRREFKQLPSDINLSWQRSIRIKPAPIAAPTDDEQQVHDLWQQSPLRLAAQKEREQMLQLAKEASLVVALADPAGRLLWTYASNHMRKRAEQVNFIAGARWDEAQMGTNAVGLAAKLQRPTTVFSTEHYLPNVHDWVCYASPIIHPQTNELVGVLDISSTWQKHTPLGQVAAAQLAQSIAKHLPAHMPKAELEIYALGQHQVCFYGKALHVSQRQLEMLCLLALNPQGLSLEVFHAALYGDAPVSLSTLKAELSHLRRILDGKIGSRPYRLLTTVWADFICVWSALRSNEPRHAFSLYRGVFLPQTSSPELEGWRNCIEAIMGEMVNACDDAPMLMDQVSNSLVRERLMELVGVKR